MIRDLNTRKKLENNVFSFSNQSIIIENEKIESFTKESIKFKITRSESRGEKNTEQKGRIQEI